MASGERFGIEIGDMQQPEYDLLACLVRIRQGEPVDARADALVKRLVEAGLVDCNAATRALTSAGIGRCQSLQHRQAGDAEAAQVLWHREHPDAPAI